MRRTISRLSGFVPWIVFVGAAYAIAKISKRFLGPLVNPNSSEEQHKVSENVIKNLVVDGNKLSKTVFQCRQAADFSHQAMAGLGTDEDALFGAVDGFNQYDLQEVAKQFGTRSDTVFVVIPLFEGNIFDWYQSELAGESLERMKAVWAKTGLW